MGQNENQSENIYRELGKLLNAASKYVSKASEYVSKLSESAVNDRDYKEIVYLNECLEFYKECKRQNPAVAGFIISVKKNYDQQNENDKFLVIQGMIDRDNRPISTDGERSLGRIIHTKTIDQKILTLLNGEESRIIKDK